MSEKRQRMLDEMIRIYGFEHEVVIAYAEMLERWDDIPKYDKMFEDILKWHQENPELETE